jgi:hypothetical protein
MGAMVETSRTGASRAFRPSAASTLVTIRFDSVRDFMAHVYADFQNLPDE